MRLQTFRIRYCFGFVDSGEVDLREPNNLVWILGRNSSGKSSMLSALEQLASGKRPDEHPRFANFDPPPDGRYSKLEAKFSVAVGELSIRPVIQRVLDSFAGVPVDIDEVDGRFTAPAQPEVDAVLVAVQDGYQALLSATEEAGEVRIVKDYDAEYFLEVLSNVVDSVPITRRPSPRFFFRQLSVDEPGPRPHQRDQPVAI